jgi:hypothetical protein
MVKVLLSGGPDIFSSSDRRRRASAGEPEVKVPLGHCIEHFCWTRRAVSIEHHEFQTYHWASRTYVAE